jgi:fumarate hydratase subunit beta
MPEYRVDLPFRKSEVHRYRAGDILHLWGEMLTGRDAAHKKMFSLLMAGEKLPVCLRGETIYYVGPCPAAPGRIIGSAGPTTSGRMDAYTPLLLQQGLTAMIGKGQRSEEVRRAIIENGGLYLLAVGGAGALLSQKIKGARVIAFAELGPESIFRLKVEDFPVIVGIDAYGTDIYERTVKP